MRGDRLAKLFLLAFAFVLWLPLTFSNHLEEESADPVDVGDYTQADEDENNRDAQNSETVSPDDVTNVKSSTVVENEPDQHTGHSSSENEPGKYAAIDSSRQAWMNMIMNSDYSKHYNETGSLSYDESQKEKEEEEEQQSEVEDSEQETRLLLQLVNPESGSVDIKPKRVQDKCKCGSYNSPRHRIINGEVTEPHQYPWMVSVQVAKNNFPFCGASIISDRYVITAAHCTDGMTPEEIKVRFGDHDLTSNDVSREKSLEVDKIIQHEEYNPDTVNNDISLLRVEKEIYFTWRVSPICLNPVDFTFYKEKVTVMGWGKMDSEAKLGSPVLQHTDVQIFPMRHCRHNFKFKTDDITSKMMCAQGDDTDACQGDSGGPLVWKEKTKDRYFLVGITSWGIGCGIPHYPGVYAKVMKFLDWIYENTQDSTYCSSYVPKPEKKKKKVVNEGVSETKGTKGKIKGKGSKGKGTSGKGGEKKKKIGRQGKKMKLKASGRRSRKQRLRKKKSQRRQREKEKKKKKKKKSKGKRKKLRKKYRKQIRKKIAKRMRDKQEKKLQKDY